MKAHESASLPLPTLELHRAEWRKVANAPGWSRLGAETRFRRSYVVASGPLPESECWPWIGTITNEGYGRFVAAEWKGQAHRYALESIAGWGPIGRRRVGHRCGNKACVNPDHLICDDTPLEWDDPITAPHVAGSVIPRPATARFWANVDREKGSFCWWWTGTIGTNGYGQFTVREGWPIGAHRMAYALAHGTIPADRPHVCHGPGCEDRSGAGRLCVNPAHLRADTAEENLKDRDGGHFRHDLDSISMTDTERRLTKEFLPHVEAALAEETIVSG